MKLLEENYFKDLYYLFLYSLEKDLAFIPTRVRNRNYFELQVKVLRYIDTAKYLRQHNIKNYLMRLNDVISRREDDLILSMGKMIQSECKDVVRKSL